MNRTSILISIVPLIAMLISIAGGILLIVFSRRRGPEHPACGGCGYNVQASIETGSRCPECGEEFSKVGIDAPRGRRGRNPYMLITGILLIVGTVGCCGSSVLFAGARQVRTTGPPAPPAPAAAAQTPAETEAQPDPSD